METIAESVGISPRRTQELLRELAKAGWISVEFENVGGRSNTNRYRLNLPKLIEASRKRGLEKDARRRRVKEARNPAMGRAGISDASHETLRSTAETLRPVAPEPELTEKELEVEQGHVAKPSCKPDDASPTTRGMDTGVPKSTPGLRVGTDITQTETIEQRRELLLAQVSSLQASTTNPSTKGTP